ncbi:protein tesmin/TSO1-like CXC 2 [Vigna radiata var. radiata]|uniref:Protein tesmin/TSO1-like CXC 2 n=1 Tax=Vigna radiata var. radiata TaxID=3916 RepID=A0A1S3VS32_VIGRR|nr:protein tesmin/TSO1-like CXC 2 [Vigna radiata var. radiata]
MDTPERNQISATLSKFEDSPVFNYINSLSPIKPVKSVPISQTFNSLSFSSPPSVFTSPHVSCLKESRFLRRHIPLGTWKPKVSSEDVNKVHTSEEETLADSKRAHHNKSESQENTEKRASIELSSEHIKFSVEPQQSLKYDTCGSPGYDPSICDHEDNTLLELPGEAAADAGYVQEGCKTDSVESEVHLQEICQMEPKSEDPDCYWDSLIPDGSDMLIFNSPGEAEAFKGLMNKPLDPSIRLSDFMSVLPLSAVHNGRKMFIVDSVASGSEHEIGDHCSQPTIAATDTDQTRDNLADVVLVTSNYNENANDQLVSVTHRAIRRRCLDFEMANVQKKNSDDNSKGSSSTSESDERNVANEKQLLPAKLNQRGILQGIGLHLNALAALKEYKGIQIENLSSGRQLSLPNSTSLQISTSQEQQHLSLVPVSSERDLDSSDNGLQPTEDCSQPSVYMAGEDFNKNSPRKKKRKLETPGETEGCKRCNCKKSKCLKLYCECFAAGVYCIEPCSCQDCFNKPVHEDTVLQTRKQIESRNPLAFAPKVIRSSDSVPEIGDDPNKTPASARHKRGCNCKKSSCLKKYCECYQGGVGCSIGCRCEGCKNAFGRKDGSAPVSIETEQEETEATDKGMPEKASQKIEIQNTAEDHPDSAAMSTPLRLSRPFVPLPFSSKGKAPRSFVTTISGSALFASQKLGKTNSLWSQSKHFQSVPDDEMQDILLGDTSPITCIKTSSPNGKRISSPSCDMGSSPSRRGGRKLILQSIPSFPSLTPHP